VSSFASAEDFAWWFTPQNRLARKLNIFMIVITIYGGYLTDSRHYTASRMIDIRACLEEDFSQIARLLRQLWPSTSIDDDLLRSAFLRGLKSSVQHDRCAVENGQIVGFCSLTLKNSLWQQGYLAHLDDLVVDESAGRGIGSRRSSTAIEVAKSNNATRIELHSSFHRIKAHQFYEQKGFENRAFLFSASLSSKRLCTEAPQ
jgi:glucosamine-phosphate N-acetyltransferase